uniref:Uncharacterized protein n=1 Tax=Utricularia reniformis TaxID=192314 RepID=A0A1Y0B2V8_9LAMI|nr:hypothetical protein AEK19_MT1544 [Utricularia reniformis]ART31731.1 hypothetical protein AEK19_MT1544 [Utricularia reniformis]
MLVKSHFSKYSLWIVNVPISFIQFSYCKNLNGFNKSRFIYLDCAYLSHEWYHNPKHLSFAERNTWSE